MIKILSVELDIWCESLELDWNIETSEFVYESTAQFKDDETLSVANGEDDSQRDHWSY